MKNKIPCEIIKDLLPSYLDELTSEESNNLIKEHLAECESCRKIADRMGSMEDVASEDDKKELNFLKKSKKKTIAITSSVIIAAFVVYIIIFNLIGIDVGLPVPNDHIRIIQLEIEGKTLNISGYLDDYDKDIKELEIYQDNGVVIISVIPSLFNIHTQNGFNEEYIAPEEIKGVCLMNDYIWYEGEEITETTAQIYSEQYPYVGDSSVVQHIIDRIGLNKVLDTYELEIHSDKMPYGITLTTDRQFGKDVQNECENRMKQYATILIGAIDNLSYVTYQYYIDGELVTLTFDENNATEFVGKPVKEQFETPVTLQEMLMEIGFIDEF